MRVVRRLARLPRPARRARRPADLAGHQGVGFCHRGPGPHRLGPRGRRAARTRTPRRQQQRHQGRRRRGRVWHHHALAYQVTDEVRDGCCKSSLATHEPHPCPSTSSTGGRLAAVKVRHFVQFAAGGWRALPLLRKVGFDGTTCRKTTNDTTFPPATGGIPSSRVDKSVNLHRELVRSTLQRPAAVAASRGLETRAVLKACIPARVLAFEPGGDGLDAQPGDAGEHLAHAGSAGQLRDREHRHHRDRLFQHADHADNRPTSHQGALRYRSALYWVRRLCARAPFVHLHGGRGVPAHQAVDLDVRRTPGTAGQRPHRRRRLHPPGRNSLRQLPANWENFLHNARDIDPLVRMAAAHYQFSHFILCGWQWPAPAGC